VSALKQSPVLRRAMALLCDSAASAISGELAKYYSRTRGEAFQEASEIVLAWSERRADRQTIDNILMELDMRARAESEAGKP